MSRAISVSREFGSGGRELGKRLADALGYDYYDREIVEALSSETGMSANYLENQLENGGMMGLPIHFAQTFARFPAVSEQTVRIMPRITFWRNSDRSSSSSMPTRPPESHAAGPAPRRERISATGNSFAR